MTTNEDLIEKIAYTRAFLEDASAAGLLPPHVRVHLITHLDARAQLVEPHASEPWPEPPVGPTTSVPPQPAGTGTRRTFATSAPSRVRPVPARRFDTDAAVRGLAALGVFLLIAATLGFVLFAFAGVHSGLRPVAELLIPVLLAGASRLLRGRLSPVAADGLAFAAGAVVPVVAFAAFVDGAPLPPDLAGRALAATWTIAAVALAAAYAAWARIRPATPLRFLVAPLGWLAVATGAATAEGRFSARAMLLAAVAVAVTAAAVRLAPSLGAAQAAAPGVWPASLAVFAAALAALARDGWPPVPAFGTGAAVVVALGLARAPDPRAGALLLSQVAVALGTAAALLPALGIGWGAAALVLLLLVILESPATSSTTTLGEATGLLVVLLLLATAADLDALTVAGAATGAWGHLRALTARSTRASDRAAWVGPLLALFAATVATSPTAAVFGGVAVIVGLTVATTALRLRGEGLYTWWLPVASAVVAVPAAAAPGVDAAVRSGALALLAAVVGTAPALASGPRVWAAAVPALASWHFLLAAATIDLPTALALWALAGAVLAAVGILRSHRAPASARQLLLIGHLVLLGCLVAAGRTDAVPLPLLVLWTAGWATTLASPRAGRGAVVWALAATTPLLVAPLDVAGSDGRLLAALVALSALGVGLQRERPEWTTAGVALLLVTIAPSGADGLTGALALVALTCLAGGVRAGRGRARAVLLVVSALASVASWASLLVAVGASSEAATVGTALVAGAVLAAAGLAVRGGAPGDAALVWGSAWAVVLGVVAGATAANVPRDGWGPLALALALAAVGAASAAAPFR